MFQKGTKCNVQSSLKKRKLKKNENLKNDKQSRDR